MIVSIRFNSFWMKSIWSSLLSWFFKTSFKSFILSSKEFWIKFSSSGSISFPENSVSRFWSTATSSSISDLPEKNEFYFLLKMRYTNFMTEFCPQLSVCSPCWVSTCESISSSVCWLWISLWPPFWDNLTQLLTLFSRSIDPISYNDFYNFKWCFCSSRT